MAETNNKVPKKNERTLASAQTRQPSNRLRREMDSLFEDFFGGRPPSRRSFWKIGAPRRAKATFGAIRVYFYQTGS
jgi:hypothetical protein